jgi:hypothetical protein
MIQIVRCAFRWLALFGAVAVATTPLVRGDDGPPRRKVVAGPTYAKGPFHRFLFGDDYRRLWTTAAAFEVLDLAKEAGGLSVVRRVGGQQTKGLALKGKDGRNYTFRGLEKDASHILEADLQGTIVADLLQDQMSAQHPASEVIARGILANLVQEAGVRMPGFGALNKHESCGGHRGPNLSGVEQLAAGLQPAPQKGVGRVAYSEAPRLRFPEQKLAILTTDRQWFLVVD